MLQQDTPDDYVLATGETHPVKEFVEKSFGIVGITIKYVDGVNELCAVFRPSALQLAWRGGYD